MSLKSLNRACGALAASALALTLGGCLDVIGTIDFRQNGTVGIEAEARALPEAKDAITLVEAMFAVSPDMARFADRPMCEAIVESIRADTPKARELNLMGKQLTVGNRPACRVALDAGTTQGAIDLMQKGLDALAADPSMKVTYFTMKSEGPKRYRMTLDMDAMFTDGKRNMGAMIDNLRKMVPGDAPPATQAALAKVMAKYDRLIIGIYRMFERHYPGTRFELTLKAPRIIETNMQREGNSVRLVQTYADYLAMAERPELRKGKTYFVVFEY